MNTNRKSRTSLMLMEIIITIGLFMVCSAFCLRFFENGYLMSKESKDLTFATTSCKNVMNVISSNDEPFSNLEKIYSKAKIEKEEMSGEATIYFDKDCKECDETSKKYRLLVNVENNGNGCYEIETVFYNEKGREVFKLESKKAYNY